LGNNNEKKEMGGACSTYRERRSVYRVLVEKPEEKYHLADPGVEVWVILNGSSRIGIGGMD
jgi:hypothetical protein